MITIDWSHFTPYACLAGGALIGLAASVLLVFNGRIAGISGIVGGLLRFGERDFWWRLVFFGGLIFAPVAFSWVRPLPALQIDASTNVLIVSGLLVGFGTRLGSGCTSGHGICGISRLSVRSIFATLIFMLVGFVTVYFSRHIFS